MRGAAMDRAATSPGGTELDFDRERMSGESLSPGMMLGTNTSVSSAPSIDSGFGGISTAPSNAMGFSAAGLAVEGSSRRLRRGVARPAEEYITALRKGAMLFKFGRQGNPHKTRFVLSPDGSELRWESKKKAQGLQRGVPIQHMIGVREGQTTSVFKRLASKYQQYESSSFSVIYADPTRKDRLQTLDIVCNTFEEYELWFHGLRALIQAQESSRHPGAPPPQAQAQRPSRLSRGSRMAGTPRDGDGARAQGTEAAGRDEWGERPLAGRHPSGRATTDGAMRFSRDATPGRAVPERPPSSIPRNGATLVAPADLDDAVGTEPGEAGRPNEKHDTLVSDMKGITSRMASLGGKSWAAWPRKLAHAEQPGDAFLFGSTLMLRGGGDQAQVGPAQRPPKGWQEEGRPFVVPNTTSLDVRSSAVGHRHALLVTKAGDLYSWGEGLHGALGHGTPVDVPNPLMVRSLYDAGIKIKQVATTAGGTVALSWTGRMYTWGSNLHGALGLGNVRSTWVPRVVRGALEGLRVTQVSCGARHAGCVTECGRLFTWGEGFCGKLGHGDEEQALSPRQVQFFHKFRVLQVACGVWHTAAIMDQPVGSLEPSAPDAIEPIPSAPLPEDLAAVLGATGAIKEEPSKGDMSDGVPSQPLTPAARQGPDEARRLPAHNASSGLIQGSKTPGPGPRRTRAKQSIGNAEELSFVGLTKGSAQGGALGVRTGGDPSEAPATQGLEPEPSAEAPSAASDIAVGSYPSHTAQITAAAAAQRGASAAGAPRQATQTEGRLSFHLESSAEDEAREALAAVGIPERDPHGTGSRGPWPPSCPGGALFAWGHNRSGAVGDGTRESTAVPRRVEGDIRGACVVQVCCGLDTTLALTEQGRVYQWGLQGVEGGASVVLPLVVNRGVLRDARVTGMACGLSHALALVEGHGVASWGRGCEGQLGRIDPATLTADADMEPQWLDEFKRENVLDVRAGCNHSLVVIEHREGMEHHPPSVSSSQARGLSPIAVATTETGSAAGRAPSRRQVSVAVHSTPQENVVSSPPVSDDNSRPQMGLRAKLSRVLSTRKGSGDVRDTMAQMRRQPSLHTKQPSAPPRSYQIVAPVATTERQSPSTSEHQLGVPAPVSSVGYSGRELLDERGESVTSRPRDARSSLQHTRRSGRGSLGSQRELNATLASSPPRSNAIVGASSWKSRRPAADAAPSLQQPAQSSAATATNTVCEAAARFLSTAGAALSETERSQIAWAMDILERAQRGEESPQAPPSITPRSTPTARRENSLRGRFGAGPLHVRIPSSPNGEVTGSGRTVVVHSGSPSPVPESIFVAAPANGGPRRPARALEGGDQAVSTPPRPPRDAGASTTPLAGEQEVVPGVFLTIREASDGRRVVHKARFSRKLFTSADATRWWAANRDAICQKHGLVLSGPAKPPVRRPPPTAAGEPTLPPEPAQAPSSTPPRLATTPQAGSARPAPIAMASPVEVPPQSPPAQPSAVQPDRAAQGKASEPGVHEHGKITIPALHQYVSRQPGTSSTSSSPRQGPVARPAEPVEEPHEERPVAEPPASAEPMDQISTGEWSAAQAPSMGMNDSAEDGTDVDDTGRDGPGMSDRKGRAKELLKALGRSLKREGAGKDSEPEKLAPRRRRGPDAQDLYDETGAGPGSPGPVRSSLGAGPMRRREHSSIHPAPSGPPRPLDSIGTGHSSVLDRELDDLIGSFSGKERKPAPHGVQFRTSKPSPAAHTSDLRANKVMQGQSAPAGKHRRAATYAGRDFGGASLPPAASGSRQVQHTMTAGHVEGLRGRMSSRMGAEDSGRGSIEHSGRETTQ